jgi:ABC-type nitrate/sulfonate/bicarbonate transport system permease component
MSPPPVEGGIDAAVAGRPGDASAADSDGRSRLDTLLDHKWVVRGLVWGGLLAIWQIVAMVKGPAWAPTVPATLEAVADLFSEGYYLTILESLQQMVAGFFLTVLVAVPFGILIGRSRLFEDFSGPWLTTLFSDPKEALLPLLIIVFGTDFEYRVSVVVLFAIFFVVINTAAGVRYADKQVLETARAFVTPRHRLVTRVILPAAAPFVVAGMRLGLSMALKGMIIAELWVSSGTGGLIDQAGEQRALPLFYALALTLVAIAVVISQSLLWVENYLRRGTEARA